MWEWDFRRDHLQTPPPGASHRLFHATCPECDASAHLDDPLCDSCRHLRPRHQIKHGVDPCPESQWRFQTGLSDASCPFCCAIRRATSSWSDISSLSRYLNASNANTHIYFSYLGDGYAHIDIHLNREDGRLLVTADLWLYDSPGSVPPNIGATIDWDIVKGQMALCEEGHDCGPQPTGALPSRFLVIDTVQRCLVDGVPDQRFVALSYVWGQKEDSLKLQATRKTIESLKLPGGLPPSELPATIEDAIQVCVSLNERYLWADRLCIVQDDPENMQYQIDSMGAIFSSATLVLIAAHGDHMDFGLSGVSCKRPARQERDCLLGQYVGQEVHIEGDDSKRTVWHTRGWTYQEAVLARRKLYFYSRQASYSCSEYLFYEDCCRQEEWRGSSEDGPPDGHELISLRGGAGSRYKDLERHLVKYSRLSLSKDLDIYNAFTGIANALYPGKRDVMIWGLPRDNFDQAMLWHAGEGALLRPPYPGVILPSWSWVSYRGSRMAFRQFHFVGTLVIWCVRSMSASVEEAPLQLSTRKMDSWDPSWCMTMAIACQHGCIPGISLSVCRDAVAHARPLHNGFWWTETCRPVFEEDSSPQHLERLKRPQMLILRPGVLYTKAQTAFFGVQEHDSNILIVDQHSHQIGFLGDSWACGEQSTPDISTHQTQRDLKYEFAGISLSMLSRHDNGLKIVVAITEDVLHHLMLCEKESTATSESGCYRDPGHPMHQQYRMRGSVPIVNVLLIEWRGVYARRVQLGWILLAHWIHAERELKDLYIE